MTCPSLGEAMRRREFIGLLGGLAAIPLAARAQQAGRVRRVGILMPFSPSDKEMQGRVQALKEELQNRGWARGANIEFDERWTTDNMDLVRANAANLVELKPDVIVAIGGRVISVLMQLTRTVPIIIPGSASPVEAGFIKSLARPGGNVTGFATLELSVIGRILETLKQIAPGTSRVAMIYNPDNPAAINYRGPFESSALPLSVQPINVNRARLHANGLVTRMCNQGAIVRDINSLSSQGRFRHLLAGSGRML